MPSCDGWGQRSTTYAHDKMVQVWTKDPIRIPNLITNQKHSRVSFNTHLLLSTNKRAPRGMTISRREKCRMKDSPCSDTCFFVSCNWHRFSVFLYCVKPVAEIDSLIWMMGRWISFGNETWWRGFRTVQWRRLCLICMQTMMKTATQTLLVTY